MRVCVVCAKMDFADFAKDVAATGLWRDVA